MAVIGGSFLRFIETVCSTSNLAGCLPRSTNVNTLNERNKSFPRLLIQTPHSRWLKLRLRNLGWDQTETSCLLQWPDPLRYWNGQEATRGLHQKNTWKLECWQSVLKRKNINTWVFITLHFNTRVFHYYSSVNFCPQVLPQYSSVLPVLKH